MKKLRVIAGSLKGQSILCANIITRPPMARMRESLFAYWGDLSGCSLLDLFSGSGIMALEAISRGVSSALLIERNPKAVVILRKNMALAPVPVRIMAAPVERFLLRQRTALPKYEIITVDPPFRYLHKIEIIALAGQLLLENGRLAAHHPSRETMPHRLGRLIKEDERRYGGSAITLFRRPTMGDDDENSSADDEPHRA